MDLSTALSAAGVATLAALTPRLKARLALSRAKHPSLTGHARMSRFMAKLLPFYEYDGARFFEADGAPEPVVARRMNAFSRLSATYRERYPETVRRTAEIRDALSDLQFTSAYRVPFQFRRPVADHLDAGAFVQAASGVEFIDLDGNSFHDLTGSYGVNVFGVDFYKECMAEGSARAASLGPVLGPYHPSVAYNVHRLREISGLDEVSFHMSGTEAVMQAVRLARYHTGRTHLVRFCGSYHGWWGDVQPGVGNPTPARETYTLRDMDERTLKVLRTRRDIACVLVNPLQALHPNVAAPGDGSLVHGRAIPGFDRMAYGDWLRRLRDVCSERGIVLVFDEVFVGFRLAPGGAQEYFGVRADMVTYGKTVAGGFPVGVLCGLHALMRRFRDDRPADVCLARGTFNAHPYVMTTMQVFLERMQRPEIRALYDGLDDTWNERAARLNARLGRLGAPVRVANLSSIWTVSYTQPSRYHWMLQYYLRAEGLALSWVGTGRLIFGLNVTASDFETVADRFVAGAKAMLDDGWWWTGGPDGRSIRRTVFGEMLRHRLESLRR
ncbi:MAG: aminotransferase class III-fold pyridoxal phosphate-dependent enzyme [Burkholderiales bacterium]